MVLSSSSECTVKRIYFISDSLKQLSMCVNCFKRFKDTRDHGSYRNLSAYLHIVFIYRQGYTSYNLRYLRAYATICAQSLFFRHVSTSPLRCRSRYNLHMQGPKTVPWDAKDVTSATLRNRQPFSLPTSHRSFTSSLPLRIPNPLAVAYLNTPTSSPYLPSPSRNKLSILCRVGCHHRN